MNMESTAPINEVELGLILFLLTLLLHISYLLVLFISKKKRRNANRLYKIPKFDLFEIHVYLFIILLLFFGILIAPFYLESTSEPPIINIGPMVLYATLLISYIYFLILPLVIMSLDYIFGCSGINDKMYCYSSITTLYKTKSIPLNSIKNYKFFHLNRGVPLRFVAIKIKRGKVVRIFDKPSQEAFVELHEYFNPNKPCFVDTWYNCPASTSQTTLQTEPSP